MMTAKMVAMAAITTSGIANFEPASSRTLRLVTRGDLVEVAHSAIASDGEEPGGESLFGDSGPPGKNA